MTNKRKLKRFVADLLVMYEVDIRPEEAKHVQRMAQTCSTVNVCSEGMLISTNQLLPENLKLKITLSTFAAVQPIQVNGVVKWGKQVSDHEFQAGIEFDVLSREDKQNLKNLLNLIDG